MKRVALVLLACGGAKNTATPIPIDDASTGIPDAGCIETFDDGTGPVPAELTPIVTFASAGTLTLCANIYINHFTPVHDLKIVGVARDMTFLDGGCNGTVLAASNGVTVTITDATLQDGLATFTNADDLSAGGLVFCSGASVTLDRVELTNSEAQIGGAVFASNCTLAISDAEATLDTADTDGGALALEDGGSATLTRVTLSSNRANGGFGGGAFAGSGTTLSFANSVVDHNTAVTGGGGIHAAGAVTCTASAITNSATDGVTVTGTYTSDSCDYGSNLPHDVVATQTYDFGVGASFSCTATSCQE